MVLRSRQTTLWATSTALLHDTDPLRPLQEAVDHLGDHVDSASCEDVPEIVYLKACDALKELYSLNKLYRVTYFEFVAELVDHGPVVSSKKRIRILPRDGRDVANHHVKSKWFCVLERGSLPQDMTHLPLNEPFDLGDNRGIVTECVPYLKRRREGAEN